MTRGVAGDGKERQLPVPETFQKPALMQSFTSALTQERATGDSFFAIADRAGFT